MFKCFLTLDDCVDRSCVCQLSLNEYMMMMMTYISLYNYKTNYQILVIFGMNIPGTTRHQI